MKKAILSIAAFEVECPYCCEGVEGPYSSSLMWTFYDGDIRAGQEHMCSNCGEVFELPKRVVNNKLPDNLPETIKGDIIPF